jgi:hypothetical protein
VDIEAQAEFLRLNLGHARRLGYSVESGARSGELRVKENMIASTLAVWPPMALFMTALSVASLPVPLLLRVAAVAGVLILVLDISARRRDYRQIVARLALDPSLLDRHIIRYKPSWCQRTVLYWAAEESLGRDSRLYVGRQFTLMGYRWFHIFPDRTFTRESPFLKIKFWRNLVGGTPQIKQGFRDPAE